MQDHDAGLATLPLPSPNLLEFLGWVASRPRTYADAMEAWRTSCPRFSVWEDATGDDLVQVEPAGATQWQAIVRLTDNGAVLLKRAGAAPSALATAPGGELPSPPDVRSPSLNVG